VKEGGRKGEGKKKEKDSGKKKKKSLKPSVFEAPFLRKRERKGGRGVYYPLGRMVPSLFRGEEKISILYKKKKGRKKEMSFV